MKRYAQTAATCYNSPVIEPGWRKSSHCATNACVEVAHVGDTVLVRDSKQPDAPPLVFTIAEWVAFLRGIRAGEFD